MHQGPDPFPRTHIRSAKGKSHTISYIPQTMHTPDARLMLRTAAARPLGLVFGVFLFPVGEEDLFPCIDEDFSVRRREISSVIPGFGSMV